MNARLALSLSLGANLALAAALAWTFASRESAATRALLLSPAATVATAPTGSTSPALAASPTTAGTAAAGHPADWIAQLRAAGVPPAVIAATVAADFDRRWTHAQLELQRRFTRGEINEAALLLHSDRRDEERETALQSLLGPAAFRAWHQERLLHDFERAGLVLSSQEADEVYRARTRHLAQLRQLEHARADGLLDEAEFTENAAVAQQLAERQVAAVVGTERHASLHDTEADNLGALRRQLRAAGAAEPQQSAVLQAHQQWLEKRAALDRDLALGRLAPADHERLATALITARTETQTAALGADGFAAFTQAGDPRHATLAHFAGAWGLQDREVTQVSSLLRTFDARLREQRAALPAGSPQADAAGRAVEREAETALRAALGSARFARLQRTGVLQLAD